MHKLLHNIDAYVEQDVKYMSDSVLVTLTENMEDSDDEEELESEVLESVVVEAYPADVYGKKIEGANPIVVRDFGTDLNAAMKYYNSIEHQLSMGDIIHHV